MLHFSFRIRALFLVLSYVLSVTQLWGQTVEDVAETRENVREVVELRRMLSVELRAWREQKELMESQLRLDRQSLGLIEARLEESRPVLDSLLAERSRLEEDLEAYRALIGFWRQKLVVLRHRFGELVHRFHPVLKADLLPKVRDLESISLIGDLAGMKRAFGICLEILKEANAYNKEIHLVTEIHRRKDGREGKFSVVYLGLSGGYYFSAEAGQAGRIFWKNGQWSWIEETKLLDDLMDLEAVVSKRNQPRFLKLPFTLDPESSP